MQVLSRLSERHAHMIRWLLLLGWLALISSLLLSPWFDIDPIPERLAACAPIGRCTLHDNDGNRLFWGVVIPLGILIIFGLSHELWRRVCPLAFVSQLFRALGWQRTTELQGSRVNVMRVKAESWLGRHHVQLQWSLFIAGLTLRLFVVNSNPFGLGLFLLLTVIAAVIVGWAFGGKAWCQYFCPMGPVQTVLTGPRSLLGTPSHLGGTPKISQSMCRATSAQGGEKSTCVACQTPCMDIDSERSYWQTLRGKRGLTFAWYSYPGLVLAFFLLLQAQGGADLGYLPSGRWAYDSSVLSRLWEPLTPSSSAPHRADSGPQKQAPITTPPTPLPTPVRLESPAPASGVVSLPPRPVYYGQPRYARPWRPRNGGNSKPRIHAETDVVQDEMDPMKEAPDRNGDQLSAPEPYFIGGSRKPGS
jgi:hypothetical protein